MEEREVKGHIDHNSDERRRGYDRLDYLFRRLIAQAPF
jgi:hypothetical protein